MPGVLRSTMPEPPQALLQLGDTWKEDHLDG